MPRVSVVIPTYRHAATVLETLESVFAQTFADYEVIVVNDSSPDNTAERLRPLVEAGRIRYFEQANTGQAGARNRGLSEARGEFIALLDDDDLWPPDKLEWQVAWMEAHPEAAAVGGWCELFRTSGDTLGHDWRPEGPVTLDSLSSGNAFNSPGQMLMSAQALARVGGFDRSVWGADDYDLMFRLIAQGPVEVLPRVALRCRLHAGNASSDAGRMCTNILAVGRRHLAVGSRAERRRRFGRFYAFLHAYAGRRLLRDWRALTRSRQEAAQWLAYASLVLTTPALWRHLWEDARKLVGRRSPGEGAELTA